MYECMNHIHFLLEVVHVNFTADSFGTQVISVLTHTVLPEEIL